MPHLKKQNSEDTAQMITQFSPELPYYYMSLKTKKTRFCIGYMGRKSAKYEHFAGGPVALNNKGRDSILRARER